MTILFYIFAALLIYFSFRSFRRGIDYLNYFKKELAKPTSGYTPFATVIAPCRGLDEALEANLAALLEQDYPEYEVIFAVDDASDPAIEVIAKLTSRKAAKPQNSEDAPAPDTATSPTGSDHLFASSRRWEKIPSQKIIVARTSTDSGQKVENLREAVLNADARSKVYVFVDSDARPAPNWLRSLVVPLENENIGAATGYRWFIPDTPTFTAEFRAAWNASIASALGANTKSNFCWGGSTAIRQETFQTLGISDRWKGTLSVDFTVTQALKDAGLAIHFVPQSLTPSFESCTFRDLLEFTNRQMKITRVYASHLWLASFLGSSLFTFVMVAAFLIPVFSGRNTPLVWSAIATLVLVAALGVGKAWLRLKAVKMVVPHAHRQLLPQLTLWLLTPPLFLFNSLSALLSRRLTWRGVRYELTSHERTVRLDDIEN